MYTEIKHLSTLLTVESLHLIQMFGQEADKSRPAHLKWVRNERYVLLHKQAVQTSKVCKEEHIDLCNILLWQ